MMESPTLAIGEILQANLESLQEIKAATEVCPKARFSEGHQCLAECWKRRLALALDLGSDQGHSHIVLAPLLRSFKLRALLHPL